MRRALGIGPVRRMIVRTAAMGLVIAAAFVKPLWAQNMETDLHRAAAANDAAAIERLIAAGADIDARDGSGATALLTATHRNHLEAARVLILAGADVNAQDKILDSPYLYAGARGHLGILELTFSHGAASARAGGKALCLIVLRYGQQR